VPVETPVKAHAATLQGLVAYVARMRARIGG